ncbi:hypothetical protein GLOIN_2v1772697 [Rhizophagus irregularis DAOM 181602=DAOM 197198]|uniref:Uncharacterized protein n=2 Tax=Rhizophagus irregularis TaxID=588596 RepID=U9UUA2_RHIID|nr:hypothetical protein GLOIN_2v1772697 [Rhizophagus irregularis DAOM 181602=DAOM 197198]
MFTSLLEQTLQVFKSTNVTGIFQTATGFEPAIYKHLKELQQTYSKELAELGSSSDNSWLMLPSFKEKWNTSNTSKKSSILKKLQQQQTKKFKFTSEKMILTVITEYMPEDKANVCKIVIYDIPSTIPQLNIFMNLKKWSQVIAFKVKM